MGMGAAFGLLIGMGMRIITHEWEWHYTCVERLIQIRTKCDTDTNNKQSLLTIN